VRGRARRLAQGIDAAAAPAPAVEEHLLDRVARTSRSGSRRGWPQRLRLPTRYRRPMTLAAVGLACAAIGGAVAAVTVGGGDQDLQQPSGYQLTLKGTAASPGANARAALESVPGGTTVLLWVSGLPGDPNTVYEVRCDNGNKWSASAGTFRVDHDGQASLTLTTAARRGQYNRIRVVKHGWDDTTQRATVTNVMTSQLF
jgi:hypothetical protein